MNTKPTKLVVFINGPMHRSEAWLPDDMNVFEAALVVDGQNRYVSYRRNQYGEMVCELPAGELQIAGDAMNNTSTNGNLTITRRAGQTVHVGQNILVQVVSVSEFGAVKLRISAPREIPIVREEIKARGVK